jgi:hypothetical protein
MIVAIMKLTRAILFPLLLAFVLLFAQQAGAAHSLKHDLENLLQQQDEDQAPHSCELCSGYAQLGSALSVGSYDFNPLLVSNKTIQLGIIAFCFFPIPAATARGPPDQLQRIA